MMPIQALPAHVFVVYDATLCFCEYFCYLFTRQHLAKEDGVSAYGFVDKMKLHVKVFVTFGCPKRCFHTHSTFLVSVKADGVQILGNKPLRAWFRKLFCISFRFLHHGVFDFRAVLRHGCLQLG